jgi:hypothetical protein
MGPISPTLNGIAAELARWQGRRSGRHRFRVLAYTWSITDPSMPGDGSSWQSRTSPSSRTLSARGRGARVIQRSRAGPVREAIRSDGQPWRTMRAAKPAVAIHTWHPTLGRVARRPRRVDRSGAPAASLRRIPGHAADRAIPRSLRSGCPPTAVHPGPPGSPRGRSAQPTSLQSVAEDPDGNARSAVGLAERGPTVLAWPSDTELGDR